MTRLQQPGKGQPQAVFIICFEAVVTFISVSKAYIVLSPQPCK